jgi:hypothetical protein
VAVITEAVSCPAMRWREEIDELHEFFQAYFLGTESSLERADAAFAADFTIVGADGVETDRRTTMENLLAGYAHTNDLKITISEHRLLRQTDDTLVVAYVETHDLGERPNRRRSTVVFVAEAAAPNGLQWLRVHETWIDRQ